MLSRKVEIVDAHSHFFSYDWFKHYYDLAKNQLLPQEGIEDLANKLEWEAPPVAPNELGKRWIQELDKYGVKRQVLFASKLNDAEQLTVAVQAFPDRFIGYVMIDPTQPDAREQTLYSLNILNMNGILLYPAMHHFHVSNESVFPVYEEAVSADVPVFIHFGQLKIPICGRLGLSDNVEPRYSNPIDLKVPAHEFPEVNFIIPHFGSGFFEEALVVASEFHNVFFDTSSSNSWIQSPLTLKEVFHKSLKVLGPERLLFGTDSSYFPRGWRNEIFESQMQILDSLNVSKHDKELIFGGNISRILRL